MFRKLTLACLLFFASYQSFATHATGGELRYEFNGTNYTIYASIQFDCNIVLPPSSKTITFTSSCGSPIIMSVPLSYVDTITDPYCPWVTSTCGGSYPNYRVAYYITTVSLTPCTDWHMSFEETALIAAIDNMQNAVYESMYMTATLDNSSAENNAPMLANQPPYIVGANTYNTIPMQITDADGDDVIFELKHAETTNGVPMDYETGYSATTQMGSYTAINNTNQTLEIAALTQSENYIYTSIKDYRNGVLVGTHTKAWTTNVRPTTDPEVPMAVAGTNFSYTACPGQSNTITLNFLDSTSTDTVFVEFFPPTLTGVNFTSSSTTTTGTGSGTVAFTLPTTFNVTATPYFYIPVKVSDHQCPNQGVAFYNILVNVIQCVSDSVWAGDANADFTADMNDPLAIAVAYGTTGIVRPGATINWVAEYCPDWTTQFNNTVNHKHADCNGDGTIDNGDLAAVTANYGQVHMKPGIPQAKVTAQPDLYFDLTGIVFAPGGTVTVPLKLGTGGFNMNNMYGVASNIQLQGITLATAPTFNFSTSWIGNSSNTLSFTYNNSNEDMDVVMARRDQQNVSGEGMIATMTFSIPAGTPDGTPIIFHFGNNRIIDNNGDDLTGYNVIDDTAYVTSTNVGPNATVIQNAVIVPNPSRTKAYLQLTAVANETITLTVTDVTGRSIYTEAQKTFIGTQKIYLPVMTPGLYQVAIQGASWKSPKVLKWVNQ